MGFAKELKAPPCAATPTDVSWVSLCQIESGLALERIRQASEFPFSTGELRQGHDQSLCLLLKQNPPLVYPIQMLREFACYLPVQRRHHGLFFLIRDDAICTRRLFQVPRS